jgi:hypothetical protein
VKEEELTEQIIGGAIEVHFNVPVLKQGIKRMVLSDPPSSFSPTNRSRKSEIGNQRGQC